MIRIKFHPSAPMMAWTMFVFLFGGAIGYYSGWNDALSSACRLVWH